MSLRFSIFYLAATARRAEPADLQLLVLTHEHAFHGSAFRFVPRITACEAHPRSFAVPAPPASLLVLCPGSIAAEIAAIKRRLTCYKDHFAPVNDRPGCCYRDWRLPLRTCDCSTAALFPSVHGHPLVF